MMDDFDWTDLRCPLPVLRVYHSEDDVRSTAVELCGESLGVITTSYHHAMVGGLCEGAPNHWKVECDGGHVVFTYDDEGNGYNIPFDPADLTRALYFISPSAVVVEVSP